MGNGRSAFVHTRVCISAPNLIFLRKTLFNTATALCHHPPLFSIHSRNVTPLPLSSIRLCIKRSLSFHGKTLPGILLTRYRSDYFTWIFDLNLPLPPHWNFASIQRNFPHVFTTFSLLFLFFSRGGEGLFERSSRKVELYRGQPSLLSTVPRWFFFSRHCITDLYIFFFSPAEEQFGEGRASFLPTESQTRGGKRAVEILSS